MRKPSLKSSLLATAAVLGLGAQAHAFDTVNWNWDADVQTNVTQTIDIAATLTATGLTMVENDQVFIGSASASSDVNTITVNPPVALPPEYSIDDLARIESVATAVGNNASIESEVKTDIDSEQLTGGSEVVDPLTGMAMIGTNAAIDSSSTVSTITNAQVDSAATSVGNNLAIDVNPLFGGDAILVANNVQTAYADLTSTSSVDTVTVTNYSDLGTLADPLVGSTATSVGNNLDVTVTGGINPI